MSALKPCPQCGAEMPLDSAEGMCPTCVLKHKMESNIRHRLEETDAAKAPTELQPPPTFSDDSTEAAPPELKIRSLGEYELLEVIGEGGMGQVYKAQQPALNRPVALKILSPRLAEDRGFIKRFRREAAMAASLDHPNIVQVYSAGESDGVHYFAMEFVDGESLQQRLRREGKLRPTDAIDICLTVAGALDYAWRKGKIIHRDIKPDNIFLSHDGKIKLGDLGLAKNVSEGVSSVTMSGHVVGTPSYISPEQARGKKNVDFRSDIYSLGCTLYQMLTGRPPFSGDSMMDVILKHIHDPAPKVLDVISDCPEGVDKLLVKMMAKDPDSRHQSYKELMAEIRSVHIPASTGSATQSISTTAQSSQIGWQFWFYWVIANTLTIASTLTIAVNLDRTMWKYLNVTPSWVVEVVGLLCLFLVPLAFVQRAIVRRCFCWAGWWSFASYVGLGLGVGVALVLGSYLIDSFRPTADLEWVRYLPLSYPGMLSGMAGLLVLRRRLVQNIVWVTACTLGWPTIGFAMSTVADMASQSPFMGIAAGAAVGGLAFGIITGIPLVWILRHHPVYDSKDFTEPRSFFRLPSLASMEMALLAPLLLGGGIYYCFFVYSHGLMTITTEPVGVRVMSGKRQIAITPYKERIVPGPVTYGLKYDGHYDTNIEVEAIGGRATNVFVRMIPWQGELMVTSKPPGARVVIQPPEGAHIGWLVKTNTTPFIINVPVSKVTGTIEPQLEAKFGNMPKKSKAVVVEKDQRQTVEFVFTRGSVRLDSLPSGAVVLVDGREVGRTPFVDDNVAPGTATYELRLAGYNTDIAQVNVVEDKVTQVKRLMTKAGGTVVVSSDPVAWLKRLPPDVGKPFKNSVGMELEWVADVPEAGKGCWVGKYEVTQEEYEKVMGVNPSETKGTRLPVTPVSFNQAMEFCQKLTKNEDRSIRYTLPTETQWIYLVADAKLEDAVVSIGQPQKREHPEVVGSTGKPNKFGIFDIRGNVWEWCDGPNLEKAGRGGAFDGLQEFNFSGTLDIKHRRVFDPALPAPNVGFRVIALLTR